MSISRDNATVSIRFSPHFFQRDYFLADAIDAPLRACCHYYDTLLYCRRQLLMMIAAMILRCRFIFERQPLPIAAIALLPQLRATLSFPRRHTPPSLLRLMITLFLHVIAVRRHYADAFAALMLSIKYASLRLPLSPRRWPLFLMPFAPPGCR